MSSEDNYWEKNIIQCCLILKGYAHLFDDKTAVLSCLEYCKNKSDIYSNNTYDIKIVINDGRKDLSAQKNKIIGFHLIEFHINYKTRSFYIRTDPPERLVALLNKYLKVDVNDHITHLHNKIIDLEERVIEWERITKMVIEEFKEEVINMIRYAPGGFEAKMAQKEFEQLRR